MKNVLILHGTQANSGSNWFSWLRDELKKKGFKVWLPDLPNPNLPSLTGINKFIFANKDWEFNHETIIVGHSSGAIAMLFDYDFDFEKIKKHAKKFIIVHSNNDPYGPLEDVKNLAQKLGGELIVKKDQGHFNLEKGKQYRQFPFMLKLIVE
jgi:predicted alpha/beta hydrolase family esterase